MWVTGAHALGIDIDRATRSDYTKLRWTRREHYCGTRAVQRTHGTLPLSTLGLD